MNFLSKLLSGTKAHGDNLGNRKLSLSHLAVTQFLEGKISEQELLARVMDGFILVPLAEEPVIEGDVIKVWTPAVFGKADGSQWQLVFTSSEAHSEFATKNNYLFCLQTSTESIISKLPPERGLMFNIGSAHYLEWSAEGIRRVRSEWY